MIVNIDQSNYVKDAGETAGIRLVVHTGDRMPFPEDEGITVSPGHSTSIGLQKVPAQTNTRALNTAGCYPSVCLSVCVSVCCMS